MARRKSPAFEEDAPRNDGDADNPGSNRPNAPARADTIRDCCRDLAALEAERKTLSESIAELKQTRIKGDLGMKIADFNLAYRLYKLEGDDRNTTLDALKECFKALGIGGQLSFLDALGGGDAKAEPQAAWPGGHGTGDEPPAPSH